jgi:hypothetical protein
LAGRGVNTSTILDLITAREAAASAARDDLREQMTKHPSPHPPARRPDPARQVPSSSWRLS